MALPLPPLQSPRQRRRCSSIGLFVLCTALLRSQNPWTFISENLPSGSHPAELTDDNRIAPDAIDESDDFAEPAPPFIAAHPLDRTVPEGMRTTFRVSLDRSDGTARFQWRRDGAMIPGANAASYTIPSVGIADAGRYRCDVENDWGAETSEAATLTVISAAQASRFISFSVVTSVDTPRAETAIDFAVGGAGTSGEKPILVRGVGPSLARFGVSNRNPAVSIELFSGAAKTGENDHWGGQASVVEATARVGAFPLIVGDSSDAAMLVNAAPAAHQTIKISGHGGATGVVLAELYDATPVAAFRPQTPRLINFSVLKTIATGTSLNIGFVIAGQTSKTVLVRVVGPSLANWSAAGTMPDPMLTLLQDINPIATNDNWGGAPGIRSAAAAVGALALDPSSKDAALVINLARGSYAVQASDAGNRGGIALVEIYEVP